LNEGSESEQPTRPVDLRDDGVDIDLPSSEEIEWALKYLKNNKAAGADSIAAELLKNGGPNLGNALHAVIQKLDRQDNYLYGFVLARFEVWGIIPPSQLLLLGVDDS
jgi:hypothetical protein